MSCFDHFEIDIIWALSEQLLTALERLDPAALTIDSINALEKGQGIYQLYSRGSLVYVGKAQNLKKRLVEHHDKIAGRLNIDVVDVAFTCLFVHPNWTGLAPEAALINHHKKARKGACAWNGNGFGPHDTGRDRDTTDKRIDGFDKQFPIRVDWTCEWIAKGSYHAFELLLNMKRGLPYLLRFQMAAKESKKPHAELLEALIEVPSDGMTARELLLLVASNLSGWQATVFPGHMILYKEEKKEYAHGRIIWPIWPYRMES